MPSVSLITPCYNGARFIGRTIESVLSQTFSDWEYIIVDDGSTDNGSEIVADYARHDPRIRLFIQSNHGANYTRNRGYEFSDPSSSFLCFLDQDDTIVPTMLETMLHFLQERPDAAMVYCRYNRIDEHDRVVRDGFGQPDAWQRYVPTRWTLRRLSLTEMHTPFVTCFSYWPGFLPSTSIVRRSIWCDGCEWDETLGQMAEDWDVFCNVALRGSIYYLNRTLVNHRLHSDQVSAHANKHRQQNRYYAKWLTRIDVSDDQRKLILSSWRFRQHRLLPYLWANWGIGSLREGHVLETVRCFARAIRAPIQAAGMSRTESKLGTAPESSPSPSK